MFFFCWRIIFNCLDIFIYVGNNCGFKLDLHLFSLFLGKIDPLCPYLG